MKKKVIVGLILLSFVLLSTAAWAVSVSEERIIKELINIRNETLSAFYDGGLSIEEAEETIKKIEAEQLLIQDLDNLRRYFQTDIDQVEGFEIKSVKVTESDDEIICAEVYIKWDVETLTGKESFICEYSAIAKKENNSYKLVQFY